MDDESLPLVSGEGMSKRQLRGMACASCRKQFPPPECPVGVTPAGEVLRACEECIPLLEHAG